MPRMRGAARQVRSSRYSPGHHNPAHTWPPQVHTAQRVPSRAPHVPLTTRHARRRDDPLEPRIRVRIEKILRELAHGCAAGRPLVRLGLELLLFGLALLHCSAARSSCLLPAALLRRRLHVGGAGRRR